MEVPPREGSIQEPAGESAKALGNQIELQCLDKLGEPPADLLDESSCPPIFQQMEEDQLDAVGMSPPCDTFGMLT